MLMLFNSDQYGISRCAKVSDGGLHPSIQQRGGVSLCMHIPFKNKMFLETDASHGNLALVGLKHCDCLLLKVCTLLSYSFIKFTASLFAIYTPSP